MSQFDLKKAIVYIRDGGSNELEVHMASGTFKYTEQRTIEFVKNRGLLDTVREGDEQPVDVTIDATWDFLRSASGDADVSIEEAIKGIGEASTWVSTGGACEPYAVDVVVEYDPVCNTALDNAEVITLSKFFWEKFDHDAKSGMLNISGKCNVKKAAVSHGSGGTAT